jgi:spermidine/putrescine transport system substrate-binding protein
MPRPRQLREREMTARRSASPQDPLVRALVQAQLARPSRRAVLAGAGALGLTAVLAACGTKGSGGGVKLTPAQDLSASKKELSWANWTLYLDVSDDGKTYPSLEEFTRRTGITVNYSEDIDGNDTYYGKVQEQLSRGQSIGRDIITLTDWMAGRIIRQGWVQELDHTRMPHVDANMLENLKNVDFDPGRKHSVTWQTGYAGICWNKAKYPKGLRTVSDLWASDLKGRVTALDEMRDTMGLLMLDQGTDISSPDWGDEQFENALETLNQQVQSGQIRKVQGNAYKEDLISGDALAGIVWSGDITQLNFEHDNQWEFVIPEAGGTLWSDNLMVPMASQQLSNCEKLMDFYYEPEIAAQVAAYVNYICPVKGAQQAMEKIDPELVNNPLIFPTEADLEKAYVFRALTPGEESDYTDKFQTAIGA